MPLGEMNRKGLCKRGHPLDGWVNRKGKAGNRCCTTCQRASNTRSVRARGQKPLDTTPPGVRFWRRVNKGAPNECWTWAGNCNRYGYGRFHADGRRYTAHRFSLVLAGVDIDGWVVRHTCDNPPCVNPGHLLVGTPRQNSHDAIQRNERHGNRGEAASISKLTDFQAYEIRRRRAAGERSVDLAGEFGVSASYIKAIVAFRNRRHVTGCPSLTGDCGCWDQYVPAERAS